MGPEVYLIWEDCFFKNQSTKYLYNHETDDSVIMLKWPVLGFQRWPVHMKGPTSSLASSWSTILFQMYFLRFCH